MREFGLFSGSPRPLCGLAMTYVGFFNNLNGAIWRRSPFLFYDRRG
jgi:hypothetical protein